jgi:type I restriction enzyme S subunit
MKAGWQTKMLEEVCEIEYGTRVVQKRDGGTIYSVYGGGGATFHMDTFNREDRLVIARFGMSESCMRFVEGKFFLNDSGLTISPKSDEVIPRFVDYKMLSMNKEVYDLGRGTAQKNLDVPTFRTVPFSFPVSIAEQQRIVSILDEAFAGIAKATANAEKNLANARELFESYLQSVFDNKGRDWEEKRLGEVSDLLDCLHKTPKYVDSGFPMVRVTDVKKGYLNLSRTKQVDKMTFDAFSKKYTPKIGDIVFSRVGSYGVSSLVNSNDPFCLGQNTVFIIPKIHPTFLYYFLNSSIAKLQYDELVEGVTQPTISMKSIRAVSLFVPPSMEEQSTLAQKIDELSTETKRLEAIYQQKLVALEELKKSILNQAFSGQLQ